MDVGWFLTERIRIIRYVYDESTRGPVETKRLIEAKEAPFEPMYSEDAEPAFLGEWIDADVAIDLIGRNAVSMLAASLKLYFATWERLFLCDCSELHRSAFKQGFLRGYQACFDELDWSRCPADLQIIEQIVLARNTDQHPESITSMRVDHSVKDEQRFGSMFFVNPSEQSLIDGINEGRTFFSPSLSVSREQLALAIDEVEKMVGWAEPQLQTRRL